MKRNTKRASVIFIIAFITRCVAAAVTTLTNLNPDSTADAVKFGQTAETIAQAISNDLLYLFTSHQPGLLQLLAPFGSGGIFHLWGTFLAPFWLFPGPSGFYARLGNAFLGALAIYNVYLIARYYHSHQAGVIAATPLIFYPSIIAVHSTLLREAVVLFGITTATRLLVIPSNRRPQWLTYVLAGGVLYVACILRMDNTVIYAAAIGSAVVVYASESGYLSDRIIGIGAGLSPAAFIVSYPYIQDGVAFLARTRELRTKGRAAYLPDFIPRTVLELIAFSWIGAAYLLYAPFPWMIATVPDLLVGIEGLINIVFTLAAVWGVRSVAQRNTAVTVGLCVGFVVAVVFYGVGTGNYGTGMRHRQMFLWVIFLFGGIGISDHMNFISQFPGCSDEN